MASYGAIGKKERWTPMVSYGSERVNLIHYNRYINSRKSTVTGHSVKAGGSVIPY